MHAKPPKERKHQQLPSSRGKVTLIEMIMIGWHRLGRGVSDSTVFLDGPPSTSTIAEGFRPDSKTMPSLPKGEDSAFQFNEVCPFKLFLLLAVPTAPCALRPRIPRVPWSHQHTISAPERRAVQCWDVLATAVLSLRFEQRGVVWCLVRGEERDEERMGLKCVFGVSVSHQKCRDWLETSKAHGPTARWFSPTTYRQDESPMRTTSSASGDAFFTGAMT